MLKEDTRETLQETLAICGLHHQRMMFAFENVKKYFPLTESEFGQISPIEMALFDQLVYRFSKLQDSMGTRLFRQLLLLLEEDISGLPFIDILNKMEKLNLLNDSKDWISLRQTRNTISHEYPFYKEVQIEELNLLPADVEKLSAIWIKLKDYTNQRLSDIQQ